MDETLLSNPAASLAPRLSDREVETLGLVADGTPTARSPSGSTHRPTVQYA
ncbi:MAG: hypothetical protein M3256_21795 [Actinomycetota bacterium]|nr:hypothetical protein [Actinomycetota bacterium]